MTDLIYIGVVVVFFAVERLVRPGRATKCK